MDDRPSGQRIEIELTEHADTSGAARWRRGRHALEDHGTAPHVTPSSASTTIPADAVLAQGDTAGGGENPSWGTERRRLAVTALAAAVIALFVGWALGRSGGTGTEEASGAADPVSTSEPADSDDDESSTPGSAVPTVAPDDLPATTRPFTPIVEAGPTTTTVPKWEATSFEIDPALAGADVQLVALTRGGMVEADLATGEGRRFAMRTATFNDGQPQMLFAGDDWVLVHTPDRSRSQLFVGDAAPEDVSIKAGYQVYMEPGADVITTVTQRPTGSSTSAWEISQVPYDGSPPSTVTTLELPDFVWAQSIDPLGGLIVAGTSGGAYRVGTDGVSARLTTGQLFAVSASQTVASECGETIDACSVIITDRATGERRQLPVDDDEGVYQAVYGWYGSTVSNVSPTGEFTVVIRVGDAYELGLLSLVDGSFHPISRNFNDGSVVWSADGRYAFFIDSNMVFAYDTVLDAKSSVFSDVNGVAAVAVRPPTR